MAGNSNNTSSAGLFGQPLDGDLLFDQISGPKLFMPIPVAPVEVTPPAPTVSSLPPGNQHVQLPHQNLPQPSSLPPNVNSSFPGTNHNVPPKFFQPQEMRMTAQDLVGPPTGASSNNIPKQIQQPMIPAQQQQQISHINQMQQVKPQPYQQYQQHVQPSQMLYQQTQLSQEVQQPPAPPQLYQPHQKTPPMSTNLPYSPAIPPSTQSVPPANPQPSTFSSNVPLYSPPQQLSPQRPTQIVPPTPQQVKTLPHVEEDVNLQPQVSSIPLQSDLNLPSKPLDSNLPADYNISPLEGKAEVINQPPSPLPVQTLTPHWFYCKGGKKWTPFSYYDSHNLETLFLNPSSRRTISTDGGRFDVDLVKMTKTAVYWSEQPCEVRRCSWFFKGGTESKLVPFDITTADLLEKEYVAMMKKGVFNVRVDIGPGKFVVFHNPNVLVQYTANLQHVAWSGEDSAVRPKVVKRGIADIQEEIERGETEQIDHLVFVVHGIGPVADLRMRSIVECVDDFRKISFNQVQSHGFTYNEKPGNRVEFLPIHWHLCLRDDKHGVDRLLKALSLPSIGKLRNFTNETLTDILFFTSPIYCQTICDTVVSEMNRIYKLFKLRNPSYSGSVSVVGHSLGSCILFDILAHQVDDNLDHHMWEDVGDVIDVSSTSMQNAPLSSLELLPKPSVGGGSPLPSIDELCAKLNLMNLLPMFKEEQIDTETIMMCSEADLRDLEIPFGPRKKILAYIFEQSAAKTSVTSPIPAVQRSTSLSNQSSTRGTQTPIPLDSSASGKSVQFMYEKGNTGIGQPLVKYSKLEFQTSCLFCLGSPIGLFLTCRGIQSIGTDFSLPKCPGFMNIFHPYDPVVYRLEPLINEGIDIPPSLIPHHKGRKRFHLEIKENLSRAGQHLKHSIMDSVNRTWSSIRDFAKAHRTVGDEEEVNEQEGTASGAETVAGAESPSPDNTLDSIEDAELASKERSLNFGKINNGSRVDYVLQENPFELINEYIFALSSHTCYWTSDDTALLIVDRIYNSL